MKQITSISLALLLVLSQLGLGVGVHYCMGMAVKSEVMLGQQSLDCGMGMEEMMPVDGENMLTTTPCCQNTYSQPEISDDFSAHAGIQVISPEFVVAFLYFVFDAAVSSSQAFLSTRLYESPPNSRDIQVAFQVFRI